MNRVGLLSESSVTFILLLFGCAGLIGSYIFSRWSDKSTFIMMLVSTALILVAMLLMLWTVKSLWWFTIIIVVWGTAMLLLMLTIQSKVIEIDINAQDMVMAMFSGVINLGIGMSALLGGYAVTYISLSSIGFVGAAISFIALLLIIYMLKRFDKLS